MFSFILSVASALTSPWGEVRVAKPLRDEGSSGCNFTENTFLSALFSPHPAIPARCAGPTSPQGEVRQRTLTAAPKS